MPAKKLTKANCHPRYGCSKLLLVDAILIWFSDRMLFTLTTLNWTSLKLNYASVIFVDPGVQIDET